MNQPLPKIDFAIGGQAVIEGVMMRSPNYITIAVRRDKGDVSLKDELYRSLVKRIRMDKVPIVRGIINLVEMMVIGVRMLNYSATVKLEEQTADEGKTSLPEKIIMGVSFAFSLIFALALSIFLFKFLPLWITDFLSGHIAALKENYLLFNLIDGILKTAFFVIYIAVLGMLPDLRRVFEYHGAEHKSIYTYEKGMNLTVDNAKKMSRFHPRCGTSFILVVFLISILVYTFIPRQEEFMTNFWVRLTFLPFIAGISYEFLKWSAKNNENRLVRLLITPGLWFQRLTTREPDDKQLEVALQALSKALEMEKKNSATNTAGLQPI